jgi:hypothetical protein
MKKLFTYLFLILFTFQTPLLADDSSKYINKKKESKYIIKKKEGKYITKKKEGKYITKKKEGKYITKKESKKKNATILLLIPLYLFL